MRSDRLVDRLMVGDVGDAAGHRSAVVQELPGDKVDATSGAIDETDFGTLVREEVGARPSHPRCRSGYHDDFVLYGPIQLRQSGHRRTIVP